MEPNQTEMEVLISNEQITRRIAELASEISGEYGFNNTVFVTILEGARTFSEELTKQIARYAHLQRDYIKVRSYKGTESTGKFEIEQDIQCDVTGKNVLLLEDIVDTGRTLDFLKRYFIERNANSVEMCALLDKPSKRITNVNPKYVGFEIDDLFVVGYGMDYKGKYRDLPNIHIFK